MPSKEPTDEIMPGLLRLPTELRQTIFEEVLKTNVAVYLGREAYPYSWQRSKAEDKYVNAPPPTNLGVLYVNRQLHEEASWIFNRVCDTEPCIRANDFEFIDLLEWVQNKRKEQRHLVLKLALRIHTQHYSRCWDDGEDSDDRDMAWYNCEDFFVAFKENFPYLQQLTIEFEGQSFAKSGVDKGEIYWDEPSLVEMHYLIANYIPTNIPDIRYKGLRGGTTGMQMELVHRPTTTVRWLKLEGGISEYPPEEAHLANPAGDYILKPVSRRAHQVVGKCSLLNNRVYKRGGWLAQVPLEKLSIALHGLHLKEGEENELEKDEDKNHLTMPSEYPFWVGDTGTAYSEEVEVETITGPWT